MKRLWPLWIFINCSIGFVLTATTNDLTGRWILNDEEGKYSNLKATVPGGIYTDLMANNIIENIFYEDNDVATRWVSKTNWTYSRTFAINEEDLHFSKLNLVFKGLDTFSSIYVNDKLIGKSENMFVQYVFDIKSVIHSGINSISVHFESPVEKAQKLFEQQKKDYEVKPNCVPSYYRGECHANHVRKMQASFSWDWGPAFPSVGIWKKVYIEKYNASRIRYVTVNTVENNKNDNWEIHVETYLTSDSDLNNNNILIRFLGGVNEYVAIYDLNTTKVDDYFVDYNILPIPKSIINLWWPNGYGEQPLYNLSISIQSKLHEEKDTKDIQIGFRTIKLNQDLTDDGFRDFYIIVNGIPIFAKGSNIIPIDVLPERGQNSTTIQFLLQSVKETHMNMLRVWGGGVYESEEFYNTADKLGILIWQDFMFACSMYPTNQEFLNTVEDEVKHQVRRLQHHPSIAIWAANNENEAALRQNWYGTSSNFSLYKNDFIKLYIEVIKPLVLSNDKTREFLSSSPTNAIESEKEGYIATNPQDEHYGDVHYYNYILDSWNTKIYPTPRFASEYGYQSLPSLKTLLTITDNITKLDIKGELMDHRQHHQFGYTEMHLLASYRLKLPDLNDTVKYLKTLVYYGQIVQAMAIKIETEHYRRWKGVYNSDNKGNTMGALYWQLNDVWVAPTWAGIDFNLNWKMLHYFSKNFFAPIIITYELSSNNQLSIFVINDYPINLINSTAKIEVFNWNNMTSIHSENIPVPFVGDKSEQVTSFWLDTYLMNLDCGTLATAKNNCFIYLSLFDENGKIIAPTNYVFPVPLKNANLQEPTVTIESINDVNEGLTFEIKIKTNKIALFVWLETQNIRGKFSENGYLQVNELHTVLFYSENVSSKEELEKDLVIVNLMSSEFK